MKKYVSVITLVLSALVFIVVHEIGHLIFCIIFGAEIQGFGFSQSFEGVFVIWEKTSTPLYNDLINLGGLLFGFVFYVLCSLNLMHKKDFLVSKNYRVIYVIWFYIALLFGRNYELNLLLDYSFIYLIILVYISFDMFKIFLNYIRIK